MSYDWPKYVSAKKDLADESECLRSMNRREPSDSDEERPSRSRCRRDELWSGFKQTPMKPNKYDSTIPLDTFIRQFEVCSKYNEWTDNDKAAFIQCSLEKGPAQLLWDFGAKEYVTYKGLVYRLRQRYGLEAQQETFRTQLRCRKHGNKRAWLIYCMMFRNS